VNQFKLHIGMLIIICLGIFFAPAASYACSAMASHHESKSKCATETSHHGHPGITKAKGNNHGCPCGKDCNGGCKHRSCNCDACGCSLGLVIPLLFKSNQQFAVYRKLLFPSHQAYICAGFNYIWLPPKIG
jgi:hypothetical protein